MLTTELRELLFSSTEPLERFKETRVQDKPIADGNASSISVGGGNDSGNGEEEGTEPEWMGPEGICCMAAIVTALRCQESSISPTLLGSRRRAGR